MHKAAVLSSPGGGSQLLQGREHVLDDVVGRVAVADVRPHSMTASGRGDGPELRLGLRVPADDKCDAERDSGQCVGDVVEGVAEQGDRSRHCHNRCLCNGGSPQGDKGDRDGSHALGTRLQRVVDVVRRVVGVGSYEVPEPSGQAGQFRVRVRVIVPLNAIVVG